MTGDTAVTDDGALDASDPVAGAIDNTTSTLIDNYGGTSQTDAASVSCAKFTLNRIVNGPDGNNYDLNNDRYGNGDECASNYDGGTDFTVYDGGTLIHPSSGPRAYPNLIRGCSSSGCYTNNWPKREGNLSRHWSASGNITSNNARGKWNANMDIWFNRSDHFGPSGGTEILIDFNRNHASRPTIPTSTRPTYWRHCTNVITDGSGHTYDLYFWRRSATINGTTFTWNFLHFWRNSETYSVNNLNLNQFWDKAATFKYPPRNGQPYLRQIWYLTGIDTGFEIWTGGYGLHWSGVGIHN
jgi:hypothetical protein